MANRLLHLIDSPPGGGRTFFAFLLAYCYRINDRPFLAVDCNSKEPKFGLVFRPDIYNYPLPPVHQISFANSNDGDGDRLLDSDLLAGKEDVIVDLDSSDGFDYWWKDSNVLPDYFSGFTIVRWCLVSLHNQAYTNKISAWQQQRIGKTVIVYGFAHPEPTFISLPPLFFKLPFLYLTDLDWESLFSSRCSFEEVYFKTSLSWVSRLRFNYYVHRDFYSRMRVSKLLFTPTRHLGILYH